jgi:hypothetical protein
MVKASVGVILALPLDADNAADYSSEMMNAD